ncbi:MAG: sigma-70 family RNA polymerase sigma factor [Alphaproteobacteria bacterium]|nr:sigma-70 family RNA polymerase sigma factor [Alphaproteobacteria bacterium]
MTPEAATPEALMCAAQAGDKQAYTKLLRSLTGPLQGYIARKTPAKDREEVLQNVLLSLHRARHTYDPAKPLMPWVMAIARYRLNDYWRHHYGRHMGETDDIEDFKAALATDVTEGMENSEDIRRVMAGLPEKQRKILQLMYGEDKSVTEVAGEMGMSVSAVKVAAHRSYKVFRKSMKA